MWDWILFLAPIVLGAVLGAAFARGFLSVYALMGVGLVLGFGLMPWAYLSAPHTYDHTEGRQFLGRWWDPEFVATLAAIGYVLYLVGIGVGAFTREVAALFRHRA